MRALDCRIGVKRCAREDLCAVLDMHAVQGGHNQDWHSDSGVHKALFWQHEHFQDRTVDLWTALAKCYAGNVHVRARLSPESELL